MPIDLTDNLKQLARQLADDFETVALNGATLDAVQQQDVDEATLQIVENSFAVLGADAAAKAEAEQQVKEGKLVLGDIALAKQLDANTAVNGSIRRTLLGGLQLVVETALQAAVVA